MVMPVEYNFHEKEPIGTIKNKKKTRSDKGMDRIIGFEGVMDHYVELSFKGTYIEAETERSISDDALGIFVPKVIISPVIENLNFVLTGKDLHSYTGKCTMRSSWKIYLVSEKEIPLANITINTSIQRPYGTSDYIIEPLIKEASKQIISIDTLNEFLLRIESEYLSKTKGKAINVGDLIVLNHIEEKDIFKKGVNSVVTINHSEAMGSGIIISADGYIVTNYHVIQDAKNIIVRTNNNSEYIAEVIKINADYDLALLKIKGSSLQALPFGNSDLADIGDDVYAIGTPLSNSLSQSVSKGIISGKRTWNRNKIIQTDVSINSGNSGGALINKSGQIIGITTFKVGYRGYEGLGFCIPSNTIIEMLHLEFTAP